MVYVQTDSVYAYGVNLHGDSIAPTFMGGLQKNEDSPTDQFAPTVTAIDGEVVRGQITQRLLS